MFYDNLDCKPLLKDIGPYGNRQNVSTISTVIYCNIEHE